MSKISKAHSDSDLMQLAIAEHMSCSGFPRVGTVIAKDGQVLSKGFRGEVPGVHAERVAIGKLSRDALVESTLYTTLEPCVSLYGDQKMESCADLIINSGISEVFIGVLDPNATIYSQGYKKLLENNISVKFFNRKLRSAIEEQTFEFGAVDAVYGSGKRRVPVIHSGIRMTVYFSETDKRSIPINWATLQARSGCVDLSSNKGAVTVASGASKFSDITDPTVFRFPDHYARMRKGEIAVVHPEKAGFCVLIQLMEIFERDILFQWQVRNVS